MTGPRHRFVCIALTAALFAFACGYLLGQTPVRGRFEILTRETPQEPAGIPAELDAGDETETIEKNRGLIRVNQAGAAELADLPGVGPVLAQRIVAYREENGPFTDMRELTKVKGIGEKILEKIAEYITLEG